VLQSRSGCIAWGVGLPCLASDSDQRPGYYGLDSMGISQSRDGQTVVCRRMSGVTSTKSSRSRSDLLIKQNDVIGFRVRNSLCASNHADSATLSVYDSSAPERLVGVRISILQLAGKWISGIVQDYNASTSQHTLTDDEDRQSRCSLFFTQVLQ
jgi:hypothetical protein